MLIIFSVTLALLPPYLITFPFGKRFRRFFSYPFYRTLVHTAGLKLTVVGNPKNSDANFLISNHVSYLDIPVLASMTDGIFVAKADVAKWPVIGFLAKIGRTQFVSRKATKAIAERDQIASRLKSGERIFLFPEGSSGNGRDILPFKPGLLSTALLPFDGVDISIQPVSLVYGDFDTQEERDLYAWYGDMDLAPHVWRLLGQKQKTTAKIIFHNEKKPDEFKCRKELAKWAELEIRQQMELCA
ncbi:lysophospholipid acyltransferase family protein [Pseudemcibacter aquimaris]|uniref:lysophospholipid acyltransferase family protein n=1 Tax=Pseudemcibacter aquimaris TaxID=2857064 RepID=UPI00201330F1|nr:lysophospholipid acyltransferase family protein [Pseudemcibacter aquimaris]MCC3862506.1 1-acyl-sn-glycerol-3-phosphate acyltransferase [Pseudemcibacter aquimaris]WDU57768.1 1-acyl-sn-glycerol-3-phosphate acyltransferase [Pseudemcibacter aquimaris]